MELFPPELFRLYHCQTFEGMILVWYAILLDKNVICNGSLILVGQCCVLAGRSGLCRVQEKLLESLQLQGPMLGVYFPPRMYSHFGDLVEIG